MPFNVYNDRSGYIVWKVLYLLLYVGKERKQAKACVSERIPGITSHKQVDKADSQAKWVKNLPNRDLTQPEKKNVLVKWLIMPSLRYRYQ